MSAAFTPGPWHLRLGSLRASVETPSGNWFKSHRDGESETSIATDARLIAAAPELLEALENLRWAHTDETDAHALAAIAKARGETVK